MRALVHSETALLAAYYPIYSSRLKSFRANFCCW